MHGYLRSGSTITVSHPDNGRTVSSLYAKWGETRRTTWRRYLTELRKNKPIDFCCLMLLYTHCRLSSSNDIRYERKNCTVCFTVPPQQKTWKLQTVPQLAPWPTPPNLILTQLKRLVMKNWVRTGCTALLVGKSQDRSPVVSLGIFSEATYGAMCPGIDSASKNEYQENSRG